MVKPQNTVNTGANNIESPSSKKSQSQKTRAITQSKVNTIDTNAKLIEEIDTLAKNPESRTLQQWTFTALSQSLRRWETGWTIKLPTGTGKTRVFSHILKAFQKNWIILVPRIDLYDSTARDLREVGFDDTDIRFLHTEDGWNTENRMMSLLADPSIEWKSGKTQCIMTYQALTGMIQKNPQMQDFIRSHFDIVIEDEAHRGLWDKTKSATEWISHKSVDQVYDFSYELDDNDDIIIENEAEKLIQWIKYNYKFTATPDLLAKSVTEDGEYIFYATVEEAVKTGAIILPQYEDVWAAYTKNANLESWKVSDIEKLSEWDNFVDESGISIRDKVIEAYIEKKKIHKSLPGVAFASTIEHARQIVEAMESKWIRATRVTSASSDISSKQAIKLMNRWELDIIVTVTKVSEGFDYKPLACAMWFCPSLSSAKVIQWNGRIMRITDNKKPEKVLDENGRLNYSPNSYIISPSAWYGVSSGTVNPTEWEDWIEWEEDWDDDIITPKNKKKLPRIGNFYELLIERGELDINSLSEGMRGIIDLGEIIRYEPGEEIEIERVIYMGVTWTNEVFGVKWFTILRNAKYEIPEQILNGRQKNGMNINLVPKSFIMSLRVDHTCEPGEEREIDGIVHIGVIWTKDVLGVKWQTILSNFKKTEWVKGIEARQKNGKPITLVPKSFIEGLKVEYTCEVGEEREIDGIMYIGVTNTSEVLGVKWERILYNLKKIEGVEGIEARQKNGKPITLVPKSFIEGLKVEYTCEVGEEREIDGIVYIGVNKSNGALGVKWERILYNLKKIEGVEGIKARQKDGYSITLVPKSFIEGLKKK